MPLASDSFLGLSTLGLAVATTVLAAVAIWQLIESRAERKDAARSLAVAEATFRTEQRPELVALGRASGNRREVHLAAHGSIFKIPGEVIAEAEVLDKPVGLVSFEALNIGRGAAEISRIRLMSLDTAFENDGRPEYWGPDISARNLIVVAAGGIAPVDLVLAPQAPSWFCRHMQTGLKFWVEITYSDLGGVEQHTRWFEFQKRPVTGQVWFVGQVLRSMPSPFSNLPPGNPLIDSEAR